MESPLNSAHLLSRQADRFLSLSKFEEAIECHQKAADLLDQAMSLSSSFTAQESLRLQRNDHIRQEKVIRSKQHQHELSLKANNAANQSVISPHNGNMTTDSQLSDDMSDFSLMSNVQRNMVETDSLLHFLEDRCMSGESVYNPPPLKDVKVATKIPKDDKLVIEELSMHNMELRKHVLQLLNDLDNAKYENTKLKKKLEHASGNPTSNAEDGNTIKESLDVEKYLTLDLDNIDSLDLPPLEMPNFDFNSIQEQINGVELEADKHTVS